MIHDQETPDERMQRIAERIPNIEKSLSAVRYSLSRLVWLVALSVIGYATSAFSATTDTATAASVTPWEEWLASSFAMFGA